MTRTLLRAVFLVLMLGPPAAAQGFDDYPFLGRWTCGEATYTFTADTFNDGTQDYFVRAVVSGLHDFRIILATGTEVDISAVTDTTMVLDSEAAQDRFTCTRQ